jgi:3-oxoacyl-[acyl-carrier-protein] synthase I
VNPVAISHCTLVTALGDGCAPTLAALLASRSGLAQRNFESAELQTWLGVVDGLGDEGAAGWIQGGASANADAWPGFEGPLAPFDCRNNRLAARALLSDGFGHQVRNAALRYGAHRVGVFLGTSTSGILHTELAYRQRDATNGALPQGLHYGHTQNSYSVARYVAAALALQGPAHVVSTACSSSAKVFAVAARMINQGLVDAAVVGGVDSLCMTTLYGFQSLELLSQHKCRPWDAHRDGLSLGEGAAFALLERAPQTLCGWLLGAGETSDGHHMSSPHPDGLGAAAAMRAALASAGLPAASVDYLNLHGTGTPGNDAAEDKAVCAVLGRALPCSSTKGFTGHTLGAAGGVEAVISLLALQHGFMPAGLHLQEPDAQLGAAYTPTLQRQALRVVASNSFGFGGSNACLVFGSGA